MKRPHSKSLKLTRRTAGTVSAAALMLGVSHAATVGLHFQVDYCGAPAYSGSIVTLPAFGVGPNGWQNLAMMGTGYGSCSGPLGFTLNEVIDTTTSANGLNPLPNGSLNVTWFGPTANASGFGGYQSNPPHYTYGGPYPPGGVATGEGQVYAAFLRDGVNFGPPGGADNTGGAGGYLVDVTGLKSVFTNSPFVVELVASSDSMQTLTNAFVVDATASTTNTVAYTNTPPVGNAGGAPWVRGIGGGLSTASGALNTDHVQIMSATPQHGGSGPGYDNAGTISGFIVTDQPVVTMSPRSLLAGPGDAITLHAIAIGVPPLALQWRVGGVPIAGATNMDYSIASATKSGNYDLLVTNLYGAATSLVAAVTVDAVSVTSGKNFTRDSNPSVPPHAAALLGATIVSSSTDASSITRSGVANLNATDPDQIAVSGASTDFDTTNGVISFWMLTTQTNLTGNQEATLFDRRTAAGGGLYIHMDSFGQIHAQSQSTAVDLLSGGSPVNDGNWHQITLSYDVANANPTTLYVDGAIAYQTYGTANWNWPAGQEIELGLSHDTQWKAYNGQLDDVRIYSRIFTDAEAATLFTGALVDPTTLTLRLDFDAAPIEGLTVNWLLSGDILQSAPAAAGPYTSLPSVTAPYRLLPTASQQYFRFTHTTSSIVSNPYDM